MGLAQFFDFSPSIKPLKQKTKKTPNNRDNSQ